MITAHEWSAAYVKAQQQAEQQKPPEPVVVTPQQARDMDDMAGIQDKEQVE